MQYKIAQQYLAELVDIFEYLHSKGIAHRDLKPDNILLDENLHLKLSDFGSSKRCTPQKTPPKNALRRGTLVGTQDYVPPEVLLTQESDTSADLWSLGCVLYEFFAGKPPFKTNDGQSAFEKILWGNIEFPKDFPEIAKDLCARLIRLEKDKRLGTELAGGMKLLKQHPFFSGIDFENLRKADISALEHPNLQNQAQHDFLNYATISPANTYTVEMDYFSDTNPMMNKKKSDRTSSGSLKSIEILKEGWVRKKGGWILHEKIKLVLTIEPRLIYYATNDAYLVFSLLLIK